MARKQSNMQRVIEIFSDASHEEAKLLLDAAQTITKKKATGSVTTSRSRAGGRKQPAQAPIGEVVEA